MVWQCGKHYCIVWYPRRNSGNLGSLKHENVFLDPHVKLCVDGLTMEKTYNIVGYARRVWRFRQSRELDKRMFVGLLGPHTRSLLGWSDNGENMLYCVIWKKTNWNWGKSRDEDACEMLMLSLLEWCDIGENILFCMICGKRIEICVVLILRKRVMVWSGSQVEST